MELKNDSVGSPAWNSDTKNAIKNISENIKTEV